MFINPSISSELVRDRQRDMRAQAARQRLARANRKEGSWPGTFIIGIAVAAAALAALVAGTAEAHAGGHPHAVSAAATVSVPAAQFFTVTGVALTAHESWSVPASGRRAHQPMSDDWTL
jgi:hypothetical protein